MLKLRSKKNVNNGVISSSDALLSNFPSKSRYAEAYRTLRTNIQFSLMERDLNSLLVTSSLQNEGKTTTVANLAYTIAQSGKSVLMVDADLRKPGLSTRFGVQKNKGLSNLIGETLGCQLNKGMVSEYGIFDLIKLKALQHRTCIMSLKDDANKVDLFFLKGELVDVYWKTRPEHKKLASTLIREELLTKEEAGLALGHQKKSVRRLGSILVNMGMIKEEDLRKILSLHVLEAYRVATEMKDGEFVVRNVSEEDIPVSGVSSLDFSQLTQESIISDEGHSFIKSSIEGAVLSMDEENLFLLPCGPIPPNPSELLGSARAGYLLKTLRQKYDVVIIDSSPILPASDALLIAPNVDGVVLVVEVGKTNRNLVKEARMQLDKAKANILGVLLNRADVNRGGYYRYYRSYYGE